MTTDTPKTDAAEYDFYYGHFGVEPDFARELERENIALRETCEQHRAYAHMMQEQRAQIAEYCRTLEKQIETLNPANSGSQPRRKPSTETSET